MFGKKRKKEQEVKTFFNEQWKEEELIGEGSYGKVYKAKKEEFGIATYSAIKQIEIPQTKAEIQTLKTEGMTQNDITSYYENTVQKWVEEIKFMSIFKDSENIVTIEDYEINKKKNEIGWIINIRMELLKNLDAYILENNITDKEILKMAIDVATALEDCEENNVVHRDIKPDNIFVNKKGIYKVGDFGIAKHIEKTVSNMSKKGTENYMAPELYKNEKGNRTVDIYSLGIMLYRYFNYNRLPFLPNYPEKITIDSREEALYKRISGEKMPAPQNAPREIAEIILKACSYYPKDRYSSATELKTDLQKVYDQIEKPKTLFDFNEKQMNKLFIENTKSDSHNGTLSVFEDETAKDKLEMTVGIGVNEIVNEQINVEQIPEQPVEEITENVKEEQSVNQEINKEEEKEEISIEKETSKVAPEELEKEPVEENKEKTKKEEKIKSPILIKIKNNRYKIILALLVILIVLGIIFIPKFKKEEEQVPVIENVRMIQVVGLTSEEATQKIDELGLEIQYEYEEVEDETQIGKVLEQSIQENQEVAKETTVTIKVAVSKQKVVVPNVVGMNINDAIQQLTAMGLPINATGQYSNDVEKDIIISQMIPEGQEVNLGMTIEVLVSLGAELQGQDNNNNNNTNNDGQTTNNNNQNTQQTNSPSNNSDSQNKEWSGWVESLPSGVTANNYNIETKTQYRYKTYTTSTSNSLNGWIQNGVNTVSYSDWSSIKSSKTKPNESDTLRITSSDAVTTYVYYHWHTKTKNNSTGVVYEGVASDKTVNLDDNNSSVTVLLKERHTLTTTEEFSNDSTIKGLKNGSKCSQCILSSWYVQSSSTTGSYKYQTRNKTIIYNYYKYTDWLDTRSNGEEETRTLYRYQAK